jgi:peroxiredoxin
MLEIGALASPFALRGIDGREYALPQSLEGEPALLVFFKTTCETCDTTFPYLTRMREVYPTGWRLWAIAQDPAERAADYAKRHALSYPVLVDAPGYEVSRLYDPLATPTLFLVDRSGRVAFTSYGFAKEELNHISRLIANEIGAEPALIAPEEDGNPAFKPG